MLDFIGSIIVGWINGRCLGKVSVLKISIYCALVFFMICALEETYRFFIKEIPITISYISGAILKSFLFALLFFIVIYVILRFIVFLVKKAKLEK
nr:hypothetical protein [Campylobacter sp.]